MITNMKHFTSIAAMISLAILSACDASDMPIQHSDSYEAGDGSKENPYLISNDMQLAKLAHDVNNGKTFSGKYFKLTKDIDLSKAL